MVTTVRAVLCVDLLFTVPMILAIGRELVENSLMGYNFWCVVHHPDLTKNLLRCTLVIIIISSSYAVYMNAANAFYNVVSLVGGVCGFALGFIYPPAMYLKVFWRKLSWPIIIFNYFIITLGVVLMVSSTYYTITAF
jgi:amino acid permease